MGLRVVISHFLASIILSFVLVENRDLAGLELLETHPQDMWRVRRTGPVFTDFN